MLTRATNSPSSDPRTEEADEIASTQSGPTLPVSTSQSPKLYCSLPVSSLPSDSDSSQWPSRKLCFACINEHVSFLTSIDILSLKTGLSLMHSDNKRASLFSQNGIWSTIIWGSLMPYALIKSHIVVQAKLVVKRKYLCRDIYYNFFLNFHTVDILMLDDSLFGLVVQWYRIYLPMQDSQVQSLGQEDPLEVGMAIHSSILACRIPWTEEPGRLQSMRSQSPL